MFAVVISLLILKNSIFSILGRVAQWQGAQRFQGEEYPAYRSSSLTITSCDPWHVQILFVLIIYVHIARYDARPWLLHNSLLWYLFLFF